MVNMITDYEDFTLWLLMVETSVASAQASCLYVGVFDKV